MNAASNTTDAPEAPVLSTVKPFASVQLLDFNQAAERLGVSYETVCRMVKAGEIPYVQVRSLRRIALEDVMAYIAGHRWLNAETGRKGHRRPRLVK